MTEELAKGEWIIAAGETVSSVLTVHHKVIDGETVITGSFNFTKAAEENNAENLLVIHDKKMAERYTENWKEHEGHSEGYGGRGK